MHLKTIAFYFCASVNIWDNKGSYQAMPLGDLHSLETLDLQCTVKSVVVDSGTNLSKVEVKWQFVTVKTFRVKCSFCEQRCWERQRFINAIQLYVTNPFSISEFLVIL